MAKTQVLLEAPQADFCGLARVLRGLEPDRVYLFEHFLDDEVLAALCSEFLGRPWLPLTAETASAYYERSITLYSRLGYDCLPLSVQWIDHPPPPRRLAADTAVLSRGERSWVDESGGLISSWHDLERFPWERVRPDYSGFELCAPLLPDGFRLVAAADIFEHVLEDLLGYQGLCYMVHDDPELVQTVFDRWGEIVYRFYESVLDMDAVGAILQSDDLGYKTSTILSLADLRRYVLPWFRRYAALAHERGRMFWLHSCGNLYDGLIDDLIDYVGVDALHSFQDEILPVTEFKARYGHRIAALGGVDVDHLVRLDEPSLRRLLRETLDRCMPGGRYAFGSGNTIANYIPLRNYLAMIEEARLWQP